MGRVSVSAGYDRDSELEDLRRTIEVVSVVISVRQGSRLNGASCSAILVSQLNYPPAIQLAKFAEHFLSLPLVPTHRDEFLYYATSILLAGDMALWMGLGRKIVERSWEDIDLGMKLAGILSDLRWGGWDMLELHHVAKKTLILLEEVPGRTLALLAALHRQGHLVGMDKGWRQKVDAWVLVRLSRWTLEAETVRNDYHHYFPH